MREREREHIFRISALWRECRLRGTDGTRCPRSRPSGHRIRAIERCLRSGFPGERGFRPSKTNIVHLIFGYCFGISMKNVPGCEHRVQRPRQFRAEPWIVPSRG